MWFYKIERDEKNKYINITWNTTMTYIKSILGVVGVGACLFNLVWLAAICLTCLLYKSPSPRDRQKSRMPSSA